MRRFKNWMLLAIVMTGSMAIASTADAYGPYGYGAYRGGGFGGGGYRGGFSSSFRGGGGFAVRPGYSFQRGFSTTRGFGGNRVGSFGGFYSSPRRYNSYRGYQRPAYRSNFRSGYRYGY